MDRIPFPQDEISVRIAKCQRQLVAEDMSGMLITSDANIMYYTGFLPFPAQSFTRANFLFIPTSGRPLLFTQTFLTPVAEAFAQGCDNRGFTSLLGPTADELADIMKELGMAEGRVGFELGFEQRMNFEIRVFMGLCSVLPKMQVIDASMLIWDQRMIKSPYEIECIRRSCKATSFAHDKIFETAHKGMSEHEISRLVQTYMLEAGAEKPGFIVIAAGPGSYVRGCSPCTSRCLEKGDMLWLDLGCTYEGYWCDFCRAGVVGGASPEQDKMQNDICDVTAEAASLLHPGAAISDIAYGCVNALRKRGYDASFDCGRFGHGMGLMTTEPPSVTVFEEGVLKEGMIINLEPGLMLEQGLYCIEENFVITANGSERLTGGSRTLHNISC